jgi:hypothetical protein
MGRTVEADLTDVSESRPGVSTARHGRPWQRPVVTIGGIVVLGALLALLAVVALLVLPRFTTRQFTQPTARTPVATSQGGAVPTTVPRLDLAMTQRDPVGNAGISAVSRQPTVYGAFCCDKNGYDLSKLAEDPDLIPVDVPFATADASISVDATLVTGGSSRLVIVSCRDKKTGEGNTVSGLTAGYVLYVAPTSQQVRLVRVDGDKRTTLQELTADGLRADQSNRIGLECKGATISPVLNGQRLTSVQDTQYPSGGFAFGVASSGDPFDVRVLFQNLTITSV